MYIKSIPREQPNQNKEVKLADSVLLSLFNNEKCNISHAPSTGLSGIQFSILNGIIDPEGPERFIIFITGVNCIKFSTLKVF